MIRGKIVIQVSSAILYGGGGGHPRLIREGEPGLEAGHEAGAHRADHVWLGALEPGGALLGVEPAAQMLSVVEPVDGPVLAASPARGRNTSTPRWPGNRLAAAMIPSRTSSYAAS